MSEADRAHERLDFEAAAESIEKGKGNTKICVSSTHTVLPGLGEQFFIPSTGIEVYFAVFAGLLLAHIPFEN